MIGTKGKNNKLKVGDRVAIAKSTVVWYCEHINDCYLKAYENELDKKHYAEVATWYNSIVSGKPIIGTVTGYGATSQTLRKGKWVECKDKNFVKVAVKTKQGTFSNFHSEQDLKKI